MDESIVNELQEINKSLTGIKRKGVKHILITIIAVILSLVIGCVGGISVGKNWDSLMMKFIPGQIAKETISIIEERFEKEAKLVTAKETIKEQYNSGKIYKTVLGKKVPLTSKSFSMIYTGFVEAGVKDLSKAKVDVKPTEGTITITLPNTEITNISLDTKNLNGSEQTKNIFNQITLQEFNDAQQSMKVNMKNTAVKNGILEKSKKGAEEVLSKLLVDISDNYDIKFVWPEK